MNDRASEPGTSGQDDPILPQRLGSPESKERRPAGTQAALDENVENPLDDQNNTRSRQREQPYPVRWLRAHYAVLAGWLQSSQPNSAGEGCDGRSPH
jgi:hypothetical protein